MLSDAVRARLRAALDDGPDSGTTRSFAEAIISQRAHPLGEPPLIDAPEIERRVADQVIRLLDASAGGEPAAEAAAELADDPALLAAFFQNLDLLPVEASARIDGIALLVMAALQRLAGTMTDPTSES